MLPQPAFLLLLVAEQLRDGEPLDRLLVIAVMRRDHPRQRRRHLRPQRNFAIALVREIEKLAHDLIPALGGIEFQRFQRRTVIFAEAVAPRHRAPRFKNVLARVTAPHIRVRERFRIKITKTGQSFHPPMIPVWFD